MRAGADDGEPAGERAQELPSSGDQRGLDTRRVPADRSHDLDLRRAQLTLELGSAAQPAQDLLVRGSEVERLRTDEHQLLLGADRPRRRPLERGGAGGQGQPRRVGPPRALVRASSKLRVDPADITLGGTRAAPPRNQRRRRLRFHARLAQTPDARGLALDARGNTTPVTQPAKPGPGSGVAGGRPSRPRAPLARTRGGPLVRVVPQAAHVVVRRTLAASAVVSVLVIAGVSAALAVAAVPACPARRRERPQVARDRRCGRRRRGVRRPDLDPELDRQVTRGRRAAQGTRWASTSSASKPGRRRSTAASAGSTSEASSSVSTNTVAPGAVNLSQRTYVKKVLGTGKPYVSSGLIGRSNGQQVIVTAVATRDAKGRHLGRARRQHAGQGDRAEQGEPRARLCRSLDRRPNRATALFPARPRREHAAAAADPRPKRRLDGDSRPGRERRTHRRVRQLRRFPAG